MVKHHIAALRIMVGTLADLSKEPIKKWEPSADFESELIVF